MKEEICTMFFVDSVHSANHETVAVLVPNRTSQPWCGQQPSELEILLASCFLSFFLSWLAYIISKKKKQTTCPGLYSAFSDILWSWFGLSVDALRTRRANVFLQGVQNCPFCIEIIFAFLPLLNWITTLDSDSHEMALSFLQKARFRANLSIFVNLKGC